MKKTVLLFLLFLWMSGAMAQEHEKTVKLQVNTLKPFNYLISDYNLIDGEIYLVYRFKPKAEFTTTAGMGQITTNTLNSQYMLNGYFLSGMFNFIFDNSGMDIYLGGGMQVGNYNEKAIFFNSGQVGDREFIVQKMDRMMFGLRCEMGIINKISERWDIIGGGKIVIPVQGISSDFVFNNAKPPGFLYLGMNVLLSFQLNKPAEVGGVR